MIQRPGSRPHAIQRVQRGLMGRGWLGLRDEGYVGDSREANFVQDRFDIAVVRAGVHVEINSFFGAILQALADLSGQIVGFNFGDSKIFVTGSTDGDVHGILSPRVGLWD